jgi:oligopeptide transport system permease protein
LPNTLGVIIIFVFLELPNVVLGEAFLSFIGLGISPPKASWGTLAEDGYAAYQAHPYIIIIPSLMIAWLILSAFFVADGLRDALDPRTRET